MSSRARPTARVVAPTRNAAVSTPVAPTPATVRPAGCHGLAAQLPGGIGGRVAVAVWATAVVVVVAGAMAGEVDGTAPASASVVVVAGAAEESWPEAHDATEMTAARSGTTARPDGCAGPRG